MEEGGTMKECRDVAREYCDEQFERYRGVADGRVPGGMG